jgi:hypothetical protein
MALIELITGDRTDTEHDDEPVQIEIEDEESASDGGRSLGRTFALALLGVALAAGLAYYLRRRGGDADEEEYADIDLEESSEAAEADAE